ncbi:MAG: hypothetical protein M3O66_08360 [Verrucomicrobiota bacterium]|nr:hypothetical protein [Verrucomicrobiota bacterium]
MNQSLFLHIVEKLEGFLGKLPGTIQKPILRELTPLKELFLQQRPPRFVLVGSSRLPLQEILPALFAFALPETERGVLMEIFRWQNLNAVDHGTLAVLDARGADDVALANIHEELKQQAADIFLFLDDGDVAKAPRKREIENLAVLLEWNKTVVPADAKVIGISFYNPKRNLVRDHDGKVPKPSERTSKIQAAFAAKSILREHLLQVIELPATPDRTVSGKAEALLRNFMSVLGQHLPNQARVEMIRVSRDREAQAEVAQTLVKSTTAVCAAIGAQPIPLADLPILTTLQLVMVSGIMHLSGRERSMRAATEFVGALGANVGVGMLLREGTRAILKFFPGWGNVVCGMVAGAGTYAIGRAAIVYFVEGVSLKDAKLTYLRSRKKSADSRLSNSQELEATRHK